MPDEKDDKPKDPKKIPIEEPIEEPQKDEALEGEVAKSKEVVKDNLMEPGALEVETMPESSELQRRREMTKKRLQELANAADDQSMHEPFEGEEGGLKEILKEANLSARHFRFCCGGILIVALLSALIFAAVTFIDFSGDGGSKDVKDDKGKDDDGITDESPLEDLDPGIHSGIQIGEESFSRDPGPALGEELGEQDIVDEEFASLVHDFAQIFNSMETDVNELLNQSSDRTEALTDYASLLNFNLYLGRQNVETLEAQMEDLEQSFVAVENEQDEAELDFFDDLRNLDANGSSASLDRFIGFSEEVVELRAEYRAREKLLEYYEAVLVAVELRIADIEFNREALIKGVQVVDIEGSDLDLIIDESEF